MKLNREQVTTLSKYFADFSKILVASVVVGFFIPAEIPIPLTTFMAGLFASVASLLFSIRLLNNMQ